MAGKTKNWVNSIRDYKRKELIYMKYEVEITSRTVYVVEADSHEEARELVINDCGTIHIADEVEDIDVRKLV